jgi:hypothetical protein
MTYPGGLPAIACRTAGHLRNWGPASWCRKVPALRWLLISLTGDIVSAVLPTWADVQVAERYAVSGLDAPRCFPAAPGIYVWFRDGEPWYLGVAEVSLRQRLGRHLRPTPGSVRGTTLKRSVAQLLGIATRAESAKRVLTQAEVDRIVAWLQGCELAWWVLPDQGSARAAETVLLGELRPPLNRRG